MVVQEAADIIVEHKDTVGSFRQPIESGLRGGRSLRRRLTRSIS